MPKYEGCLEAREISLTRKGANPHAHVLIRKSLEAPSSETPPENTDMPTAEEIQKAAAPIAMAMVIKTLGMNEITKAHFLALPDDQKDAFLAKTDTEMAEIAKAAKDEADRKAAEAEAAKAGSTVVENELRKSNEALQKRIEDLEKAGKETAAQTEIEKRAASADFAGYPGGPKAVVEMLKSFADAPEAARTAAEGLMKAQALMAKRAGQGFGLPANGDVAGDPGAALGRINKAAQELAKSEDIPFAKAYEKITESEDFADDVALASAA